MGGCQLRAEASSFPRAVLMLLPWDLAFETEVPSSATGSLACPAPAWVKDTLFPPAATTTAREINDAPTKGLSLSAAGLIPACAARAAGCAGNQDTCLQSLCCGIWKDKEFLWEHSEG